MESLDRGRKLASNKAVAWKETKDEAYIKLLAKTEVVVKEKAEDQEDQIKRRRESWRCNPLRK